MYSASISRGRLGEFALRGNAHEVREYKDEQGEEEAHGACKPPRLARPF